MCNFIQKYICGNLFLISKYKYGIEGQVSLSLMFLTTCRHPCLWIDIKSIIDYHYNIISRDQFGYFANVDTNGTE